MLFVLFLILVATIVFVVVRKKKREAHKRKMDELFDFDLFDFDD